MMTTNEELNDYWQGFSTRVQNDLNFVAARPRVELAVGALGRIEREVQRQRKLLETRPTQPAPDGGEWRIGGKFVSDCKETLSGMYAVYGEDGRFIAGFSSREEAAQIVAEHNAAQRLTMALDSQEFYELMQAYRHACIGDRNAAFEAFEAVKAFIRNTAATTTQPDAGEGR